MNYAKLFKLMETHAHEAFARQVLDPARPDYGAFIGADMGRACSDHGHQAHDLAVLSYTFLVEGSALCGDENLFERLRLGIAHLRRSQRPSGLIDLIVVNPESPPDTAFTIQLLAPIVELARTRRGDARAAAIAEELGAFVRTAAQGVVGRGFHTPNHRWVICGALGQAMTLFPELKATDYIESVLAETIDANADGEYSERSIAGYNGVVNRSLRFMADHLRRPDLLDYVRRNLDLMLHMLHPDGTAVTSISRRQDYGLRTPPLSSVDSYLDMACRDGNPVWVKMADELIELLDQPQPYLMDVIVRHGLLRKPELPKAPLLADYVRVFPVSGVWRVRRGSLSATAATRSTTAFALRYGDLELSAVKLARTSFPGTRFEGETLEQIDGGVRITQLASARLLPGYDLPLGRPVSFDEFDEVRSTDYDHHRTPQEQRTLEQLKKLHATRRHWTLPPIDVVLEAREVESGFDLRVQSRGGLDGIPFQIECCFAPPGQWETADSVCEATAGRSAILKNGFGIFHSDKFGIRIGPGAVSHRMWHMRGTVSEEGSFRVLIPLQLPVSHTLEIRYGRWSAVDGNRLV
jgi:hypothetical protein